MRHWLEAKEEDLRNYMAAAGQLPFRAGQLREWLHKHRVGDFTAMKNLPGDLREKLAEDGALRTLIETERRDAPDGLTSKWLFSAREGGEALLETVLIIEKRLSRRTVCVSCMAGCPLGCVFCATGAMGFVRNLTAGEIVEQVYRVDAWARHQDEDPGISHVVFMGMGEPLLNLDAVVVAANLISDSGGMGLSGRHITISTAGVPDGIRRLSQRQLNYQLAVSLHAPSQEIRDRLMPAARHWPLPELFSALKAFSDITSRYITFEYCLIDRFNASPKQAEELVSLIRSVRCKVNLIPLNPVPGSKLRPPPPEVIRRFQEIVEGAGIRATVRMEKGAEIGAACGQLGAKEMAARKTSYEEKNRK